MRLSIITINRNNAVGLRNTMESVFAQTCRDFEYIVIDGASSDDSVNVIKEYARKLENGHWTLENFQWISEPDTGIYNAMNKGCRLAHGEYTLMLNSADIFADNKVVERILPELHTNDIIHGNEIYEVNGHWYRDRGYGKSQINFRDVLDGGFHHQASFISKSLLERMEYYDESYKKGADTYFYVKSLGLNNASFRYVDIDIVIFDMHGIYGQNDPKWIAIGNEEDTRFYRENIPTRLEYFYWESKKYYRYYQLLRRYKIIWALTIILSKISQMLGGPIKNTVVEKIK